MDSAGAGGCRWRLPPEHQLHRMRALCAEPAARAELRTRVQTRYRRDLFAREKEMSLPLPEFVDERFLDHRRRATSVAGITCAVLAIGLAAFRWYHDRVVSIDLLA